MVDNVIPGLDLPSVVPDNLSGAYTATKHLLEFGHDANRIHSRSIKILDTE